MTRTTLTRLIAGLILAALAGTAAACSGAPTTSTSSATTASSASATTASTSPTSPSASSTSLTSALPAGAKTLQVAVTGKDVSPAPGSFDLSAGQTLRLTVTSDHNDELHVHGFDKEVPLTAGKPTTLDLVTSQPGAYEVETHHPELRLLTILVR